LVSGRRGDRRFVELGFDPRDSDIVLRVAWPLFVLNTIHYFVEDDASYLSSYRTGEAWRIPTSSDAAVAWVKDPSGAEHEIPVKEGRAALFGEHAGFYQLRVAKNDASPVSFAANLADPDESRITPVKDLGLRAERPRAVGVLSVGARREPWVLLAAAAVLLSTLEWLGYHRRVTV
jgi:hypothetical protein